jgi:hypothetical protein
VTRSNPDRTLWRTQPPSTAARENGAGWRSAADNPSAVPSFFEPHQWSFSHTSVHSRNNPFLRHLPRCFAKKIAALTSFGVDQPGAERTGAARQAASPDRRLEPRIIRRVAVVIAQAALDDVLRSSAAREQLGDEPQVYFRHCVHPACMAARQACAPPHTPQGPDDE